MAIIPEQLIRSEVLALSAYKVPDAEGLVKLDAMENPYLLPQSLREELGQIAAEIPINRYPDGSAKVLKAALHKALEVPEKAALLLGNGSDEIIQMIAMSVARPDAVLMAPTPSFVMYRMVATFCGMRYVGVPIRDDFSLDMDAMLAAIRDTKPALIFLSYPNNPTGNLFAVEDVEAILREAPGLVILDEAYHAFARESFLPRLDEFSNLLVMRTLSKIGLAGLRLGLLAGAPMWLEQFEKLRLPYNINSLTQAIATRLLADISVLEEQASRIVRERAELFATLSAVPNVTAFPSAANFVMFRVPDGPRTWQRLKEQGILVKNLHGTIPLLFNCLRVNVSTPEENAAFLAALNNAL